MGSRAHPFNVRRSIGDLRRTVFSLFHEYIVGGYISLSLESLSRGMHQSLSIFFFSRVTSPFLPVLQPRCAIRGNVLSTKVPVFNSEVFGDRSSHALGRGAGWRSM